MYNKLDDFAKLFNEDPKYQELFDKSIGMIGLISAYKASKIYILDDGKWIVIKDKNTKVPRTATSEELEPYLIDILRDKKILHD